MDVKRSTVFPGGFCQLPYRRSNLELLIRISLLRDSLFHSASRQVPKAVPVSYLSVFLSRRCKVSFAKSHHTRRKNKGI